MSTRKRQAQERDDARRAAARARDRRTQHARLAAVTAGLLVVAGAVGLTVATSNDDGGPADQSAATSATGLLTTSPPWQPQSSGLAGRLAPFDFPPSGDESYHAHVLLSVFREGQPVTVPAGIGFDSRGRDSSLHTHTPDGVIHMEADDPYPYEIGQVFAAWGVAFDDQRLGGDVTTGAKKVHVYVNGQPAAAGSRLVLKDGDNVVVAFGPDGSFPTEPDTRPLSRA